MDTMVRLDTVHDFGQMAASTKGMGLMNWATDCLTTVHRGQGICSGVPGRPGEKTEDEQR